MPKPRPKIETPQVEHWTDGTMVDNRCPECNAAFRPTTIDLGHEQTCPTCGQVCCVTLDDDMSLGRSVYWH